MCPYYLDGDLDRERSLTALPGDTRFIGYCAVFKVREEASAHSAARDIDPRRHRHRAGLSKLNSMRAASPGASARPCGLPGPVDMSSGRSRSESVAELESSRRRSAGDRCPPLRGLPRKEVIQPQLPLRLPCYDFTPVTSPTFDGSLPNGLGHRLRVLLTPVV